MRELNNIEKQINVGSEKMSEMPEDEIVKIILRGLTRFIILWIMTNKKMSGYNITKELENLTGEKYKTSSVYPILYELEENQFIFGEEITKGKRRIILYGITDKGMQMFEQIRLTLESPIRNAISDFLNF